MSPHDNIQTPQTTLTLKCSCVILLMFLCSTGVTQQPKLSQESLPKVNSDGWTSSNVCGECHQAIHAVWQQSLHSKSWTNGVFQAAYQRSIEDFGKEESHLCLNCHAPTIRHGQDYNVEQDITAEGITCDFCHSVRDVDLSDSKDVFRLTVGDTKYGPLRHAQSPVHKVEDTRLHKHSKFCASCHEYKNENGVTILGTYSEWKSSPYAKRGTQCQDCHMPLVPGRVVSLGIKADSPKSINLHDVSGSHDIERVRKAVTLDLMGYEWLGEKIWVYVKVANVGSGHRFPTGLPMHRAVLYITLRQGYVSIAKKEIPFEVVMMDKNGNPLQREHEVFMKATRIRSDTRLKPNEVRTLEVSFRDIKANRLNVVAELYYEYQTETLVIDNNEKRIDPVEMKFLIASRQKRMKPLGN